MDINKRICPAGLKNNPNRVLKSLDFITIHCTGNYNPTATAKSHADYQYNDSGDTQTSWHYTVDKDCIWQSFEDTQECWHAGNSIGNATSIGIEICVNDRAGFKKACENTAWLVSVLLKRYQLSVARVIQHNQWSGKDCPAELRSGDWGVAWLDFITMVKQYSREGLTETPIISPPTATVEQLRQWARSKNAAPFFVELAEKFFSISKAAGVNPTVVYCQSAKETGYGNFGGVLDASYYNPCGMKNEDSGEDYDPAAHKRFGSWDEGIRAQADHLGLYAGADGFPKDATPDPRHFKYLFGTAKTVENLGGKWAPSADYGNEIVKMMKDVEGVVVEVLSLPEPSVWAKAAWDWAKVNKITDGTNPQSPATREQVITMLYNYNNCKA